MIDPRGWRRFRTSVRAGLRGVLAAPVVFTTSVVTMAAGLVLLGAFLLIIVNMRGTLARSGGGVSVTAFLPIGQDPEPGKVEELRNRLQALTGVESVNFVTREAALKRLRNVLGEDAAVLQELTANPLPASFEIQLAPGSASPANVRALATEVSKLPGIDDTRFGEDWVAGYERVLAGVERLGLAIGIGLLVILGFMVGGTVRLAVHSCEDEIQIQRLVGAGGFYVRLPFYIQGALQGAIGGVVSVALLYIAFRLGLPLVGDSFQFLLGRATWVFLSPTSMLALCGTGMALGFGSAVLSLLNLEEAR